jgi:hypothetical protein
LRRNGSTAVEDGVILGHIFERTCQHLLGLVERRVASSWDAFASGEISMVGSFGLGIQLNACHDKDFNNSKYEGNN